MFNVRSLRCLFVALIVLLSGCDQTSPADGLKEGQLFPSLRLTGLDRPDIVLDDLRGRWLVLNVWATWCGACREELAGLQGLAERFAAHELLVIGLTVDEDVHIAREFLRDEGIDFANYTDPDMFIAQQLLGIRIFPDTFIIAPDGTLWRSIAGARDWDGDAVYKALRQAVDGQPQALLTL